MYAARMRLSESERASFLAKHPEWTLDGEEISRTFVFDGFPAAIAFVTECSFAAEAADHHPDIDIRWNKVTMTLTTHSASALTSKDTTLAAEFDRIAS
ncbi:MAG: 4a-hydroxytetrahydrobiopterin dehydratase [Armatimonadetes bacterium]|nr:MAG: 4a-hydroxytetrahydrobiopterin dehydratase [Armatimonadota bacterium]